ncbi:MAG TPA: tyrosine-protein phosphatase [Steroidobacteraceae bacterium]
MNIATLSLPSRDRTRVLELEGGCNFRDIGGYATGDGQTVRWGRVYRTAVLSYFTDKDHPTLLDLGVRAICDLRRAEERQREPTRWPDASVRPLSWRDDANMPTIRGFAAQRAGTAVGLHESMLDLYRALPQWMAPRIRGMFECIAAGDTPLIVHCAAGKDRTGVAIAVLLSALGVAADTIVEDYLLTNRFDFEEFIRTRKDTHLGLADERHPLLSMPAEMRQVLFNANADYLQAAVDRIAADHGDIDTYLKTSVRLDADTVRKVREQMLV